VQDISAQTEAQAREKCRREMLEKVIRLGKVVTQITNQKQCQLKIRESVQKELGFDRVGLFIYEEKTNRVQGTYGTDQSGQMEETSWYDEPVSEDTTWKIVLDSVDGIHFVEHYDRVYDPTQYENDMLGVDQHVTVSAWAGGKPVAFITADNLLTQRKFTAEQIEGLQLFAGYAGLAIHNSRWNEELEKRVTDRTVELESANREMESLSYTIGHDLRSPIRAIVAYSHMLLEELTGQLETSRIEKLRQVNEVSLRMGRMVDDFLSFLRLNRSPLQKQPVKVVPFIRRMLLEFEGETAGRKVEFSVLPMPDCIADASMLREVYFQLISNAIKFTLPRETAQIEIGFVEIQGDRCYFVRDNGVGFDMQYYPKLFGVFQRLHHASEFEGVGASLAIVQRIIQRHGGRIWAEAQVDQGATFYFTLA
jgi:signal transduction histidine kinase